VDGHAQKDAIGRLMMQRRGLEDGDGRAQDVVVEAREATAVACARH
jgi:hypothetical protein